MNSRQVLSSVALALILAANAAAGTTPPAQTGGAITWGGDISNPYLYDNVPARSKNQNGLLTFDWTENGTAHVHYGTYHSPGNSGATPMTLVFYLPNDPAITDWKQSVIRGGTSTVSAGNIEQDDNHKSLPADASNPWQFMPLMDLSGGYRIPDLAPFGSDLTIYAAVNLPLYIASNPQGFLNGSWQVDQTIDQLGIQIHNGVIAGLQGITFATTDFSFDPNSANGWVPDGGDAALLDSTTFEAANGDIGILGAHTTVPEPSSRPLYFGLVIALGFGLTSQRRSAGPIRQLPAAHTPLHGSPSRS